MATTTGPLQGVPIACTLAPGAGEEQVERWRAFDRAFARTRTRRDGLLAVHYAKTTDAVARLRALVAVESRCCSFVEWAIDESQDELVLEVRGSDEALAALSVA